MILGLASILIVVGCWLYARGFKGWRPLAFRRFLRILRAERAAGAVMTEAARAAKEKI